MSYVNKKLEYGQRATVLCGDAEAKLTIKVFGVGPEQIANESLVLVGVNISGEPDDGADRSAAANVDVIRTLRVGDRIVFPAGTFPAGTHELKLVNLSQFKITVEAYTG